MAGEATPWYNAYPKPRKDKPAVVTRNEVLAWLKNGQNPGVDFLVIDLRRTDHQVLTALRGRDDPRLYKSAGTKSLLFFANLVKSMPKSWHQKRHMVLRLVRLGSSRGRGTRAAGWFQDFLDDTKTEGILSAILLDGIGGWARACNEYTCLMDEYDSKHWSEGK
nr:hypothetical protein LTR18_011139 [Exophiala xenobiotica]